MSSPCQIAGTPAQRYQSFVRQQRLLALARHVGHVANYTLITAGLLLLLWVAGDIFVAFHSGRVRQILREAADHPQMRVAMAKEAR